LPIKNFFWEKLRTFTQKWREGIKRRRKGRKEERGGEGREGSMVPLPQLPDCNIVPVNLERIGRKYYLIEIDCT
jgi:hypothetical protein